MKLSPQWLRDFVEIKADNARLADDLTLAGVAVEKVDGDVFEMDITTNRPDAMNHYGAAREASAIYDLPLKALAPELPAAKPDPLFPIEIQEPDLCRRFTARVLRGTTVKPSAATVLARLASIDQRPINNIVDASNYVLWEIGKPTHAYDLDLLEGGKLVVRKARAGETLKTLDGVDRKLTPDDLVVADARKPVGLAGVMGGFDTMITSKTRNILIESAWFDPAIVRKMSRAHGLHTDASHRFERGADFESTVISCDRVAELVLASGGGELSADSTDVIALPMPRPVVTLRLSEVKRHLGKALMREEVMRILGRLGFEPTPSGTDAFAVRIPSWRLDVSREIDLIEEIARQHGYNKFADTLPAFSGAIVELPDAAKDARLRSGLLALGYNEALSVTFISPNQARQFSAAEPLLLANPLSDEASAMRTSLLPGMLDMLGWNLNRGATSVRLFEIGRIFEKTATSRDEKKRICLGATGNAAAANVHEKPRAYSFFDLKGDLETLFSAFAGSVTYNTQTAAQLHPGRSARAQLNGSTIAQLGQLHPDFATARKFRQEIFVAEIYLEALYQQRLRQPTYTAPPKFPAVDREFSFVFPDATRFGQIRAAVTTLNIPELRSFAPAETFRGGNIPAGSYSVLLRAVFQSSERTLREEEVTHWSSSITEALVALNGSLRT